MAATFSEHGIELRIDGGLGLIGLCDSAGGNRLSAPRLTALQKALGLALADASVRLILLRSDGGPGKAWCLGMDLDLLSQSISQGDSAQGGRGAGVSAYVEVLRLISSCPKPVLACIGGPVMAGGIGLAAACDIVYACEGATFELSEVYYGLIPANVIPFLLRRRLPLQKVKHLVLSARRLTATEAHALGLADELLPVADVEGALRKSLRNLFRAEPNALAKAKSFLEAAEGLGMDEALSRSQQTLLELMGSEPVFHALSALKEGSTPRWFSRGQTNEKLYYATPS